MKILHFDYDDLNNPYAAGGQAKATREINKLLAVHNQVLVVTGAYPGCKRAEELDGVMYRRIGVGCFGSIMSMLSFWILMPFYTAWISHKFDVVVEFFTAPFTASLNPLFSQNPVVGCLSFFNSDELGRKYHLPFGQVAETLIKRYKYVITLTRWSRQKLHVVVPGLLSGVIPRGVETNLLEAKSQEGRYVLYLGRIDIFHKGLDMLVEVWKKVYERYGARCPELVIAGGGKPGDAAQLRRLIGEKNLSRKIKLVGRVAGRRKVDILRKSIFVVYPSRFEEFGNVALEAMAVGKACVVFDIHGFDWIGSGEAVKVDRISSNELFAAVENLILSPRLRRSVGAAGRRKARKYRWEKIALMHEKFYRKVLAIHTRSIRAGNNSVPARGFAKYFHHL